MEPVAVAIHAVNRLGDITNKTVVVTGAGPIGNLIAQVAQMNGANVMLTEINDHRLDRAEKSGIKNTVNTVKISLADASRQAFGDCGFSLAVEAAGALHQ